MNVSNRNKFIWYVFDEIVTKMAFIMSGRQVHKYALSKIFLCFLNTYMILVSHLKLFYLVVSLSVFYLSLWLMGRQDNQHMCRCLLRGFGYFMSCLIVSPVRSTYGGYYGLVGVPPPRPRPRPPRPQTLHRSHDNLKNPYRIASIFYM